MADALLLVALFAAALLYASVGHAGASSYLAIMALIGVAPEMMKPAALALNVFVAAIATFKFARAGYFSWTLFWPLAALSIPCAFLGGLLTLPPQFYRPLVGVILCYCAWLVLRRARNDSMELINAPPRWALAGVGGAIGLLSGLTGVGGGIFLSPLMLLLRWAPTKAISGIAAAFILVNSLAALAGSAPKLALLPASFPLWIIAVCIGGYIGAELGSRRFNLVLIRRLLALVLLVAGVKMVIS